MIIGAAATIADYNGVAKASHVRDKLVEMTHLNETIYGAGIAASHESQADHGRQLPERRDARQRLQAQRHALSLRDRPPRAGPRRRPDGHAALGARTSRTRRSARCFEKYLKGRAGVSVENRCRVLRLIENMTLGRNAVGYLTESMHGAGSPQAQRIQIAR